MSDAQPPASKAAFRPEGVRRFPTSRLNPAMECDTAFRVIARGYLSDLTANHDATCEGEAGALHQMRIALTRLRTAISFFSPMVADPERMQIADELKWLNARLGAVRDLDVAIERLKAINQESPQAIPSSQSLHEKRADYHQRLARALRSARYQRLAANTSGWLENGPWSTKKGKKAGKKRASPIAGYGARKLARWQKKLLKKSRKLKKMGTKKRHRLRLMNKRLCYSIEFFDESFASKKFSRHQAALKHLRTAQRSLGQLNDDANGQAMAGILKRDGVHARLPVLSRKRRKRLIKKTAAAYRKLAA